MNYLTEREVDIMCNVTLNEEKQGIEVRFDNKSTKDVLDKLKEYGFRWSNRQKMWYAKQNAERLELVNSLSEEKTNTEKVVTNVVPDLWGLTRVENIGKHPEENLSTKEIAALIRKHLRSRFPMFKISVTSDFDSISAYVTTSPYEEKSEEIIELLNYIGEYIESYKANSRYDFYGGRRYPKVSYDCKYREMTVSDLNVREKFQEEKKKWEVAEEERKAAELEVAVARMEKERIESERIQAERKRKHDIIENSVECKDVDYYVLNAVEPNVSKEDNADGYDEEIEAGNSRRVDARVIREVHMSKDIYDMFLRQLLDDWSFIEKTGGSSTKDCRVNSMKDYDMMTKEERETVSWYSDDCVAIYCDGELKNVVDAQGYNYCRYVFMVDDDTIISNEREVEDAMDDAEVQGYKNHAATIEDVSTEIITNNAWTKTWNTDNQLDYIQSMKNWIYENNFKLSKEVVQQIEIEDLKHMMYRVLMEIDSITEQFSRAGLQDGQRITIMRIGDFGGFTVQHVTFKSMEIGKYAQYDNAVKLVFIPERKRKLYYNWYYSDMVVVDGWVNIPETLLYDVTETADFITKHSKFLSCDRTMYTVVEEYLNKQGIIPIVNTQHPSNRK